MEEKLVVCDTDVLIDYWDLSSKRNSLSVKVLETDIGLNNIIIPAIVVMELMTGGRNKTDQNKIKRRLTRFNLALMNNDISLEALRVFEKYRLSHGLKIPDCWVAATSIVLNKRLFTYNVRDYKFMEGVELYIPGTI